MSVIFWQSNGIFFRRNESFYKWKVLTNIELKLRVNYKSKANYPEASPASEGR